MHLTYDEFDVLFKDKDIQGYINKLSQKYKDKKVLLYGAGVFAEYILDKFDFTQFDIIGISDSKFFNQKGEFKNVKKVSPKEIINLNPDVIIATVHDFISIKNVFKSQYPEITKIPIEHVLDKNSYSSQEYWTIHNVTYHYEFKTIEDSLDYFWWRTLQYIPLIELLPVNKASEKVVLDYGCGPGNDLVGFTTYSTPKRLIGMDVSITSLKEAENRLKLHNANVEFIHINEKDETLPLEDSSIDIINCSGVLHHIIEPIKVLKEFKRVLKDDGYAQVMVYNYDCIFTHLYIAYMIMILENKYKNLTKKQIYAKLSDGYEDPNGPECPKADCYKPEEFIEIVKKANLNCEFTGSTISSLEMNWLNKRFDALLNPKLDTESRQFLHDLTFNNRGLPLYKGSVAGLGGCYKITK